MDKWSVARTVDEIGHYLELSDPNPFKAKAYERAARSIEKMERDIAEVVDAGELLATPGIGKGIAPVIEEIVRTGRSRMLEELRAQYPPGIFELLRVPRLGLKKIGVLHSELGVGSLDDLEAAVNSGKVAKLKGFGAKTASQILDGIAWARKRESQFLLPLALSVAESIRQQLTAIEEIVDCEVTGSIRRRMEVVRNVDLAIATEDQEAVIRGAARFIQGLERVDDTMAAGGARDDVSVRLHFSAPEDFGVLVLRTTGSREFVEAFEKKLGAPLQLDSTSLRKGSRRLVCRTESDVFEKSGIAFVEPERRESGDDLRRKTRKRLVEPADLRGTFHVHTTWSDGRNSMAEMLRASRDRGFDYVGISDHSKAAYYAGGLTEQQLDEQWADIDANLDEVAPMHVFRGTEADILPDGTVDYATTVLSRFDFVVASVHSNFKMPQDEMTARILRALDDPRVTFLGHLTGRLLLSREGYSVDYDAIFDKAAERAVIIEINGNPNRLDLDWRHMANAVERGVTFSIHPDAHSIAELTHVISGTWVARKGGLTAKQIFNTRPVEEVREWFEERKEKS